MVRLGPHEFDYVHCWQRRLGVSTCLVSEVPSLKNYYLDIRLLVLWYDYHCDHWLLGWHSATLTTDNVGYVHLLQLGIAMIRPDCRATEQLLKCQRTLQIEQFYVINFSGSHPPWQTWIRTKGKVQKNAIMYRQNGDLTKICSNRSKKSVPEYLFECGGQSPKKSQLSGRQTLTRKNFPDEVRKFCPWHVS